MKQLKDTPFMWRGEDVKVGVVDDGLKYDFQLGGHSLCSVVHMRVPVAAMCCLNETHSSNIKVGIWQ